MGLTDSYGIFHSNTKECVFFLALDGTFSKTDHILEHKAGFNKERAIEITPCIVYVYDRNYTLHCICS